MKRSLKENAERIIAGYREVCTMTPHVPCNPEESSDNAVRLAVHYMNLAEIRSRIVSAYLKRDHVMLNEAMDDMLGIEEGGE